MEFEAFVRALSLEELLEFSNTIELEIMRRCIPTEDPDEDYED